jgi:hypothetical protein
MPRRGRSACDARSGRTSCGKIGKKKRRHVSIPCRHTHEVLHFSSLAHGYAGSPSSRFYNPNGYTASETVGSPTFGQITHALDPRLMQIALKLRW